MPRVAKTTTIHPRRKKAKPGSNRSPRRTKKFLERDRAGAEVFLDEQTGDQEATECEEDEHAVLADGQREHEGVRAEHDAPRDASDAVERGAVAEATCLVAVLEFLHLVGLSSQLGAELEMALEFGETKMCLP